MQTKTLSECDSERAMRSNFTTSCFQGICKGETASPELPESRNNKRTYTAFLHMVAHKPAQQHNTTLQVLAYISACWRSFCCLKTNKKLIALSHMQQQSHLYRIDQRNLIKVSSQHLQVMSPYCSSLQMNKVSAHDYTHKASCDTMD